MICAQTSEGESFTMVYVVKQIWRVCEWNRTGREYFNVGLLTSNNLEWGLEILRNTSPMLKSSA